MNVAVDLPYGNSTISAEIPRGNLMGVYSPNSPSLSSDEDKLIAEAINHPIGTRDLAQLVTPGIKCAIIVDDKTRPTPVAKILPIIISKLYEAGLDDKDIFIVYALGTHHPMTPQEMRCRAGGISDEIQMFNSEFKNASGLADCGNSPDGVPISIDKRVVEADFRIGVGSIMPHPECGWGGGAKIIYPGVASERTVTSFHLSYANVDWNSYGSDRAPVRLNMEKWVEAVGLDFIVNTVITTDDEVYQVVAGHYVQAHRAGIDFGREIYCSKLPRRADIVVVTSFRADEDFWLASKAIFAGELAVKDGGTLILVTPCPEGIGPHLEYSSYVGCDDWQTLSEKAFKGMTKEPIAVSAAVAIAKMRERFDICIVSDGLDSCEVEKMQMKWFDSATNAISAALKTHGPDATVAVLPYGISTIPIILNSREYNDKSAS